jgi:hypothetical protein
MNTPSNYPPFALKPGERTVLKNDVKEYPLPDGLAAGDVVTILDFQPGYYRVLGRDGRKYSVSITSVC